MPHPSFRRLLAAAVALLLLAACGSESPSTVAPDGISTTTVVRAANGTELALVSGGGQAGTPGQPLAQPVVVRVRDRAGRPLGNRQVVFIAAAGADVDPRLARTDADGYARTVWTLGAQVGTQPLRVSGTGGTLVVTANAQAGGGARIFLVKRVGDEQTAPAGAVLPNIQATVVRDDGRHVQGAAVTFTPSDGGRVDLPTVRSNGKGITRVRWTLGPTGGVQTLTASTPGAPPVTFTATATGGRRPPSAATLRVVPDSLVLDAGTSAVFTAVVRDSSGAQLPGLAPAWSSSHPAIATVDTAGRVHGVAAGTATVTATLGALSASATVRVRGGPASIQVLPDSLVLDVGAGGQLSAVLRDAGGAVLPGPAPTWTTQFAAVATVDAQGRVQGVSPGETQVTATVGALSGSATVRVRTPAPAITVPLIQNRVASYGGYIDPSTRDVTLNFWIHTSVRNVATVSMRVRSPGGRTLDCRNADAENWFRNEFRCQVYLPRGSEPGLWRVDRVTVTKDGQTLAFGSADLDAMGTSGRAFDVYGPGTDVLPPQVRLVWPDQGTRYPDRYFVRFGVVDHVAGVRSVQATLRGPGGATLTCNAYSTDGVLPRAATWMCPLPLPPGSGRWRLQSVTVEDGAGNRATFTPQQIDQMSRGVFELTFLQYEFDT